MDFFYAGRPELYQYYYDSDSRNGESVWHHYVTSFYYAIAAIGGNELGPRTNGQIVGAFALLVMLVFVLAIFFGEIISLIFQSNAKSSHQQRQFDEANSSMDKFSVQQETASNIRAYLETTQGTKYELDELQEFFELLKPTLQ